MSEIVVKGDRRAEFKPAHQDEGRAIGVAVGLIRAIAEEVPRGAFVVGGEADVVEAFGGTESGADLDGGGVPEVAKASVTVSSKM